ncbi:uncharacterized protein LOC108671424 [Hyalella azteca]|uniref:Uncharacterized protein LOC108671424 n=1 Tax=Hyalella azteca TaxID=294128 RepID=A0A8B7NMN2_HYAAZ|nr:uncharacterized protein LOC108671424 [Hyalella azteca]
MDRSSRSDVSWLNSPSDLMERLAVPEASCPVVVNTTEASCSRKYQVLRCEEASENAGDQPCVLYVVTDKIQSSAENLYVTHCQVEQIVLGVNKSENPFLKPHTKFANLPLHGDVHPRQRYLSIHISSGSPISRVIPLLLSSGLLLLTYQVLAELHLDTRKESLAQAPTLRSYWRQLESLSSLGFKRVGLLTDIGDYPIHAFQLQENESCHQNREMSGNGRRSAAINELEYGGQSNALKKEVEKSRIAVLYVFASNPTNSKGKKLLA